MLEFTPVSHGQHPDRLQILKEVKYYWNRLLEKSNYLPASYNNQTAAQFCYSLRQVAQNVRRSITPNLNI